MNVLIAGGTGFVGRHVSRALCEAGHTAHLLARGTREAKLEANVELVLGDAASAELPLDSIRTCEAIVNLIGIKRERGSQTFERVHVGATARLIAAAKALGIRRFVHVSVVASRPDPKSKYHDTKWRAEELVRASGLDFTILRPGVIYGRGDDMVTHLVKMIRFSPLFPVVGRGNSILQPVDVLEVAHAVAAALERRVSVSRSYDLVGPNRMTLCDVVRTVAAAISRPICLVSTPIVLHRVAVSVMSRVFRNPLSTQAQLQMLIDGLYGDPGPAMKDLGLVPAPFTADVVRAVVKQ